MILCLAQSLTYFCVWAANGGQEATSASSRESKAPPPSAAFSSAERAYEDRQFEEALAGYLAARDQALLEQDACAAAQALKGATACLGNLGRHSEAKTLFSAIELLLIECHGTAEHASVVENCLRLSDLLSNLHKRDEMRVQLLRAASLADGVLDLDATLKLRLEMRLLTFVPGWTAEGTLQAWRELQERYSGRVDPRTEANLLCLLGRAALDCGDVPLALRSAQAAVTLTQADPESSDQDVFRAYGLHSLVLARMGQLGPAIEQCSLALQQLPMDGMGLRADLLVNRGRYQALVGRLSAGLADLRMALAETEADPERFSDARAWATIYLSSTLLEAGQAAKAKRTLSEALAQSDPRQNVNEDLSGLCEALAEAVEQEGDSRGALELLEQALSSSTADSRMMRRLLHKQARILAQAGEDVRAREKLRKAGLDITGNQADVELVEAWIALGEYDRAQGICRSMLENLDQDQGHERGLTPFEAMHRESWKSSEWYALLSEACARSGSLEEAVLVAERGRQSGYLLDLMGQLNESAGALLPPFEREKLDRLGAQIEEMAAACRELIGEQRRALLNQEDTGFVEGELAAIQTQLLGLRRARGALLAQAVRAQVVGPSAETTAGLGQKSCLLYYVVRRHGARLFLLTPGTKVRSYELYWPEGAPVGALALGREIAAYCRMLAANASLAESGRIVDRAQPPSRSAGASAGTLQAKLLTLALRVLIGFKTTNPYAMEPEEALVESAHRLFRALVPQAAWEEIQGRELALVIPHGPLHALPFAALVVEPRDGSSQGCTYWLDSGPALAYESSQTSLSSALEKPAPGSGTTRDLVVLMADPVLPVAAVSASFDTRVEQRAAPLPATDWREINALPGSRVEAERIAALVAQGPSKLQNELLLGAGMTEANLKARLARASILHFATHHLPAPEDPSAAALVLSTPATGEQGDGLLEFSEILPAWQGRLDGLSLVFLSACSSQSSAATVGDAPWTIPRALRLCGAASVVAALYDILDAWTPPLVEDYYRAYLLQDLGVARSLRDAQRLQRARAPEYPGIWAAFVVIGHP